MINLQSPGPLGLGELENSPNGNSILTLKNKNGEDVNYNLWINDFSSDLNMQIDTAQLRGGYTYRPIRIQERILSFTTIWSLANRPLYEKLVDAIRAHWAYNMNELVPTPASFTYFGANKTYRGFILGAQRSYAVPDTLLSYTFEMKLINSMGIDDAAKVSVYSWYVPHASDVAMSGLDNWYTQEELYDPKLGANETFVVNDDEPSKVVSSPPVVERDTNPQAIRPEDEDQIALYSQAVAAGIAYYLSEVMGLEEGTATQEQIKEAKDAVTRVLNTGGDNPGNQWIEWCNDNNISYTQYLEV